MIFIQVISVPAVVFLGLWFLGQLLAVSNGGGMGTGIAFGAHVGGFVAGLIITLMVCKRPIQPPRHRYDTQRVRRW